MNSFDQPRRLVPATIIPPDLYVERNADRQLAANVRDLGRPGYVLVARQMGKTNLLIHAKRTLETDAVRFVYVDLSVASYHDERECFRQIVDIAIDSHRDLFADLESTIIEKRKQPRPPNREHDSELRLLLTHSRRKLVIILDEIDSLVNAEFSDRVFAHIRSVYFSRINYPELGSLGYVLSGVVEPNEIIKDKKISPFNIGEKIYLDDFSFDEVQQFVKQAGLNLDHSSFERMTFWTGGNPRILWDVCSQLESRPDTSISAQAIDETVADYFLKNFDHAPVDHIRELVRENADVRSSVWSLIEGRPEEISDAAKTKLYLFGIIRASGATERPTIKNEIIARALSTEWLKGLAKDKITVFNQAQEQFDRKRYERALQGYLDYLEGASEQENLYFLAWYFAGSCHYNLGQHADALTCFANVTELGNRELEARRDMLIGICHLHQEQFEQSIHWLKKALQDSLEPALQCQIQLNLGSAFLSRRIASDLDEAEEIFTTAIPVTPRDSPSRVTLETAMLYNLGSVHRAKGNVSKAVTALTNALKVAEAYAFPAIYLCLAELSTASQIELHREYLRKAVDVCKSEQLVPVVHDPDRPLALSESTVLDLLSYLAGSSMENELGILLDHLSKQISTQRRSRFGWLQSAGQHALGKNRTDQAIKLLKTALAVGEQKASERLDCVSWLLLVDRNPTLEGEFLSLLANEELNPKLSIADMANIANLARQRMAESKWSDALDVVRKAARFREVVGPALVRNYVGLDLVEMICLENLGERETLPEIAKRTQSLWSSLPPTKEKGQVFFSDSDFAYAREYANRFSQPHGIRLMIPKASIRVPSIGRNEKVSVRYKDGRVLRDVKFKRVEEDLKAGVCSLLKDEG